MIVLKLIFPTEDNSLSIDSILIMLCSNMEFAKALYLDHSFSNDLNHVIKYCKVQHFPDGTNLLHFINYNQKTIQSKSLTVF